MHQEIGFNISIGQSNKWDDYYPLIKEYVTRNGKFPSKKDNEELYIWARDYIKGAKGKRAKNVSILYDLGYPKKEDTWWRKYKTAKSYYEKNGEFPSNKEGKKLRIYFLNTARLHPDKEKERMLKEIGFLPVTSVWKTKFNEIQSFYERNGRCMNVKDNKPLWTYMQHWIRQYGDRHPERMQMLLNIGFKPTKNKKK